MYERSAIVLERYVEKLLKLNKTYNPKKNSENYNELITEIENYQDITVKEIEIIREFDETAKKIQQIQQEQEKIYKANRKLEDDRDKLFNDLGENAKTLETKLKKIEDSLDRNNEQSKKLREEYIQYLSDFSQKQKDRNKCEKARRVSEAKHIEFIKQVNQEFNEIEAKDIVDLKEFIVCDKEQIKNEVLEIMIKNGKSEKVAFNQDVLKIAIKARIDIAEKEAECYVLVYDRMKKILAEVDNELIKLNKYKKTLRDTTVKLAFLRAEKEYICSFLDYERMTAISGTRAHKKMMVEACSNFERDMIQIKNLYELIIRETTNKSTKKAYNELYNKTYLKNIEDKEKNFEEEVNNVNISMGTVINSNYWRIEGIKNIYNVFQEEVSEKFEKDLSEYNIEEPEEEYYEEDYEEEDYEEDDYDDEYEDEEDYDDEYEDEEDDYEDDEEDYDDDYEDDYDDDYEDEEDDYDDDYEDEEEDYDDEYEDDEEDYDDEYEDDENDYDDEDNKKPEDAFEDEDNIDNIIEKSRKKSTKNNKKDNNKDNKGLFNKFFKK